MEGRAIGEAPHSVKGLQRQDILERLRLVECSLGDGELSEVEQSKLGGLGWIHDDDADTFSQDPRLVAARRELEQNRHSGSEQSFVNRNRLTEWHVVLSHALTVIPAEIEQPQDTSAAA